MTYFAKLNDNNVVLEVHRVSSDALDLTNEEQSGIEFLVGWSGGHTNWKQTSYDGSIRKNYATVGGFYDSELDAFIAPPAFPSWILNRDTCQWEAPYPMPDDGKAYGWFEPNQEWIEIK
jgi:hypothetical protein